MISLFKRLFGDKKRVVPYSVLKDEVLKSEILSKGYAIKGNVGQEKLDDLLALYNETHGFQETPSGGMFYSVYSQDLDYRKRVYEGLQPILNDVYRKLFTNFKVVINSFIVKLAGPDSEFYLHQDSTGLDESKHSPLSVWIPLQDVNECNGCLFVVPKTHLLASPYRGISFEQPFDKIQKHVLKYAIPLRMKAGDVLIFDNRILHNSSANHSNEARKVVMSGVFPKEADLISVFKDGSNTNAPIEIFKQEEDFLLKNVNFYIDCTLRPKLGMKLKEIPHQLKIWTEEEFDEKCEKLGLKKVDLFNGKKAEVNCNIIAEPHES